MQYTCKERTRIKIQLLQPGKFLKTEKKKIEKANFSSYIIETYVRKEN